MKANSRTPWRLFSPYHKKVSDSIIRKAGSCNCLPHTFLLLSIEREYKALIAVILSTLDTRSPLSMAFLNHIIDRAALPSKATISSASGMILEKLQKSKKTPTETVTKENACILWCILAERFAGDLCFSLWKNEIGDELLALLASPAESSTVRLYALLALEKFALTGK